MKKNQISLLLATIASVTLLCQNVSATPWPITEQFSGYSDGTLGSTGTGATGGSPGWNAPTSQITFTNGTGSLDGTGLGLVASSGDDIAISPNGGATISGGFPVSCYNLFVDKPTPTVFPPGVTTNLYVSFLYRFNSFSTNMNANGVEFACMELQSGGITSGGGLDAYWQLFARTNVAGQIQIGITKNYIQNTPPGSIIGRTNWATTNLNLGQTFFIVVQEQINATNADSNATITNYVDQIDNLYINPPTNTFGVAEGSLPPAAATSPIGDGQPPSSTTGPGRFFICADGVPANMDEIRIAGTWSQVTPPFGQCLTAGVSSQPANKTQAAEISTILTASIVGTGATNQWQISGTNSTLWTNIPGAFFPSYTTPNLKLASDNGNKYRVIVGVPCDGSSFTSGVATIFLTAPVVTPDGLIMDDTFVDGIPANPPVSINNSMWFTTASTNDNVDGGGLELIPRTGTAGLWIGNFVDESTTNLPVDLAVGHTMKVTLSLVPDSFNAFTNNAGLRFGVYDYADGDGYVSASTFTASQGNGIAVRGYMLNVDFGTNFSANSNLTLYARTGLADNNLQGTTGDFLSLGSGPPGGMYSNTPAFMAGTNYSVMLSVSRTGVNSCDITGTITNASGTNWSFTATETNFAYHRFDAFAIRNNTLENVADTFHIPEFKVEVFTSPITASSINITNISRTGNNVALGWSVSPAGSFTYTVQYKTNLTDAAWVTVAGPGYSTTSYTNTTATPNQRFYRVSSP